MTKNRLVRQCDRCGREDSISAISGLCDCCESIVDGAEKCEVCGYPVAKGESLCEDCKLAKQG